jgi:hypothetical protein
MFSQVQEFARHAARLRTFVRTPMTVAECVERLRRDLGRREQTFLDVVDQGVFAQPASPYRRLFEHAGIERGDVARLVEEKGVDGAVGRLYEAGVYVSLQEFRGQRPIERPGLSLSVSAADFDNPLANPTWRAQTGGSRSLGRQVLINFEHIERNAVYWALFLFAHDASERPGVMWRPLDSRTAVNNALRSVKLGRPLEKWFSHSRIGQRPYPVRSAILTGYALLACRLWAEPLPTPEHVPMWDAARVARCLETKVREGTPALFQASVGSAVRVALAAREDGNDIAGTLFRVGSEPLTPARAAAITATGCSVYADYSMAELGRAGVSCAAPNAVGEVHVMVDKLALIQRPRVVPSSGESVGALFYTSLLPSSPKLMINVETDDYGHVEERRCGCPIGELGYALHLHGIRSYEKLTSEGVALHGHELVTLLEHSLPARFGGAATDYQLVEEVDEAVPTLSVVVSPRVGPVDERQIVDVVLSTLSRGGPGAEDVSNIWRGAGTLRVVRREPYATAASKVLPIHVLTRTS